MVFSSSSYVPPPSTGAFEEVWTRRKQERAQRNHFAPMPDCQCGIYAAKSDRSSHYISYAGQAMVWGEVYLWGKIQEYTQGYRAEFAYPKSLKTRDAMLAPKIAERYGVPCEAVAVQANGGVYDPLRQIVGGVPMMAISGWRRGGKNSVVGAMVRAIFGQ